MPMPTMFTPLGVISPTMQQILVVPMSKPTMSFSFTTRDLLPDGRLSRADPPDGFDGHNPMPT
jgi:hypothetical protein